MQYFITTPGGERWNFDDDVKAINTGGVWSFKTPQGVPLVNVPTTLQPATAPTPFVPTLADNQAAAIAKIDADVDAIYQKKIGNRQSEYSLAESDANSYKTAAYPASPVPASVQSWATAKNWTPRQAADDIILTASNWRTAQADIRTNRLAKKEAVRTATTQAAIDTAMSAWATFVTTTRTSLGI